MEHLLTALERRLDRLEDSAKQTSEAVKDIRESLLGNEFNKTGLVHTIAEHHQRLNSLERTMERGKWLVIGLSVGSGVGAVKIVETILKYL
jgi:predicted outer membrane protein